MRHSTVTEELEALTQWLQSHGEETSPEEIPAMNELDLSYKDIRELPQNFRYLTVLVKLCLSGNKLTDLPKHIITHLTKLEILILYDNHFSTAPKSIGALRALIYLDLENNILSGPLDSIWQLTSLQTLNLKRNELTELSEDIGQLTALVKLILSGNSKLTSLPKALKELKSLKKLELQSMSKLTRLSVGIFVERPSQLEVDVQYTPIDTFERPASPTHSENDEPTPVDPPISDITSIFGTTKITGLNPSIAYNETRALVDYLPPK